MATVTALMRGATPRSRLTNKNTFAVTGTKAMSPGGAGKRKGSSKGGKTGVKITDENENIESEYIYNLQQQIYFLELEMKYLRQREVAKEEGPPLPDEVAEKSAPLEKHMKSLKQKFVDLEKKHSDELQVVKDKVASLEDQNSTQHFTILHLQTELASQKAQFEQMKEDHQMDLADWTKIRIALEKEIEGLKDDLAQLGAAHTQRGKDAEKLASDLSETRLALEQAKKQAKEREKSEAKMKKMYDDLVRDTEQIRIRIVELEEERIHYEERMDAEKQNAKLLSDEKFNTMTELKQAQLALDTARRSLAKMEQDCNQLVENNTKLQAQLADLTRDRNSLKFALDQKERITDANQKQRIAFDNENKLLKEKIANLEATIREKDEIIGTTETSLERALHEITLLRGKIEQLQADIDHLKQVATQQDEVDAGLRHDKAMLQAELGDAEQQIEDRNTRIEDFVKEKIALEVEVERLRNLVRISRDIENLNLGEFQTMLNSNARVAEGLKSLIGDLQDMKGLAQDIVPGLHHPHEEDEHERTR